MNKIVSFGSSSKDLHIGGKASNINAIFNSFQKYIPNGFIIPVETFSSDFDGHKFSKKFESELMEAYLNICNGDPVAVRSSALSEDLQDKSFAGQYETILDVNKDNLIKSIVNVSLSKIRSKEYEKKLDKNSIAVIIQKMIYPELSGIIFTKNPKNDDDMLVELVNGSLNKLVSGIKSSEIAPISINRLHPYFNNLEDKLQKIIPQLYKLSLSIETHLGFFCDIEWCYSNDKLYILQARPITTLSSVETFIGISKKFDKWTDGNVGEVLPEKMTPLSWSIFGRDINNLLRKSFEFLPRKYGAYNTCFIKLENSTLYYNIGAINHFTSEILGFPHMDRIIGGSHFQNGDDENFNINWLKVIKHPRTIYRNSVIYKDIKDHSENVQNNIRETSNYFDKILIKNLSESELIGNINEIVKKIEQNMYLHTYATSASFSYVSMLYHLMQAYKLNFNLLPALLSNIEGVAITNLYKDIEKLISKIVTNSDPTEVVLCLKTSDWETSLHEKGLTDVKKDISGIITKYRHRGNSELELSTPNWGENPRPILNIISDGLKSKKAKSHELKLNVDIIKIIEKQLKKRPRKLKFFKKSVEDARRFTLLRENNKHYLYMLVYQLKRYLNELRSRLVPIYKKYFFLLTFNEINSIVENKIKINEAQLLVRERAFNNNDSIKNNLAIHNFHESNLQGIGVSVGSIKGKIKILNSFELIGTLEEGDILVTRSIDIGWIPAFTQIKGLITEVGGVLSHASIIAREYGLPVIVNVHNATKCFKNGEEVILDADKGTIYKL